MADRMAADTDAAPRVLIPEDIAELLGPRPLLSGESMERYDAMFARFIIEFEPEGVIEWVLLREVHDLTWEIQRVRGFIASLVDSSRGEALARDIDLLCEGDPEFREQLLDAARRAWSLEAAGKAELVNWSRGLLHDNQITLHTMKARAVKLAIHEVSQLERICVSLERRRCKALNEFHAYRVQLRHLARLSASKLKLTGLMPDPTRPKLSGYRAAALADQLVQLQSDIAAISLRRSGCLALTVPDVDRYAKLERAEQARLTRRRQLVRCFLTS